MVVQPMSEEQIQVLHPPEDGLVDQGRFLRLLIECFQVAAKGKKRAELQEIQVILFQLGWHP